MATDDVPGDASGAGVGGDGEHQAPGPVDPVRQPLPPEAPMPGREPELDLPLKDPVQAGPEPVVDAGPGPTAGPDAGLAGQQTAGPEWWRAPANPDQEEPGLPGNAPDVQKGPDPAGAGDGADDTGGGWPGVREEWRHTWEHEGRDGVAAAYEIGAHIGEAISERLPDAHAAAERRGLDLRWLHLKINAPAIALALLVTWGGRSATDRMTASVAEGGLLAPPCVVRDPAPT